MTFVAFALVFAACDKHFTNELDGSDLLGNKKGTSNGMTWDDSDKVGALTVVGTPSDRKNASGPKIPSNAHSDKFPGIYFIWDWKQTHGLGYLKVQEWVFEEYESFTITSKESNLYWDFKIELPKHGKSKRGNERFVLKDEDGNILDAKGKIALRKTEDNCYVFHIDRNWKNVNMVFVPEFETKTPPLPCEEFEVGTEEYCDCLDILLSVTPYDSPEYDIIAALMKEAGCGDPGIPACEYVALLMVFSIVMFAISGAW